MIKTIQELQSTREGQEILRKRSQLSEIISKLQNDLLVNQNLIVKSELDKNDIAREKFEKDTEEIIASLKSYVNERNGLVGFNSNNEYDSTEVANNNDDNKEVSNAELLKKKSKEIDGKVNEKDIEAIKKAEEMKNRLNKLVIDPKTGALTTIENLRNSNA